VRLRHDDGQFASVLAALSEKQEQLAPGIFGGTSPSRAGPGQFSQQKSIGRTCAFLGKPSADACRMGGPAIASLAQFACIAGTRLPLVLRGRKVPRNAVAASGS